MTGPHHVQRKAKLRRRVRLREWLLGPMVELRIGQPDGSELVLRYRGDPGEDPSPRPFCFCSAIFWQSCYICDPNGTKYAVTESKLVRVLG